MALQIWLPLDGTLENKGCADVTVTANGATVSTEGKIGSCYSFDGDDYLLGAPTVLNNETTEWSYACWFKPNSSHNGCLFSNRSATNTTGITIFYYSSQFFIDDGVRWITSSKAVTVGAWNHLTVTRNSTSKNLYLNGELIDSTTTVGAPTTANPTAFAIGGSQQASTNINGNFYKGLLNDVRIYDHCLSQAEVHEIAQGLVLHYKLDNIMDDLTIVDSSGYGHHGKCFTNTIVESDDTARYSKSIYKPSGTGINCGRGGMVTDSLTVNLWAKWSTWSNPVSCTEGGGWNFEYDPMRFASYISDVGYNSNAAPTASTQPSANKWHMLTGVFDRLNHTRSLYIDGELVSAQDSGSTNPIGYNSTNVIWLGAEANGTATGFANATYNGYLSDFRIYCTALSDKDIKDLYQTSAKIDKTGKVHTFEFIEDEGTKIAKTGITEWKELIEETENTKFNSQYISANEFIEK